MVKTPPVLALCGPEHEWLDDLRQPSDSDAVNLLLLHHPWQEGMLKGFVPSVSSDIGVGSKYPPKEIGSYRIAEVFGSFTIMSEFTNIL